jgi:hypothetical protein
MIQEHYIMGSGDRGYTYAQVGAYETLDDAIKSAKDLFDLGQDRTRTLKRNESLGLNSQRDGAEYVVSIRWPDFAVEITRCYCDDIEQHNID